MKRCWNFIQTSSSQFPCIFITMHGIILKLMPNVESDGGSIMKCRLIPQNYKISSTITHKLIIWMQYDYRPALVRFSLRWANHQRFKRRTNAFGLKIQSFWTAMNLGWNYISNRKWSDWNKSISGQFVFQTIWCIIRRINPHKSRVFVYHFANLWRS